MRTWTVMVTRFIHHLLDKFQIPLNFQRLFRFRHFDEILQCVPEQEALLFIRIRTKTFHHIVHDKVCLLHLISPLRNKLGAASRLLRFQLRKGA
jgi:hypothetical protein